jgi:antitoxin YefM
MATETTYTHARANLKALLDEAVDSSEPVIIRRKGGDVALIAVAELRGLIETAHLLRSPKNAERLLRALERCQGRRLKPELSKNSGGSSGSMNPHEVLQNRKAGLSSGLCDARRVLSGE